jgi:2,3-diketo-5-methylthio-1-phosphopentane phosphatase
MQIFCDFDGTVSIADATDQVLSHLADPQWEAIEQEWSQGLIGSGECMRRQISLLRASTGELDALLDTIAIDPAFGAFLSFCNEEGFPITIVSDGVGYFILRILSRYGIAGVPIIANKLAVRRIDQRDVFSLGSPFATQNCVSGSGICKCAAVKTADMQLYIGDGRSDFCVADKVDLVFAKDLLADYCAERAIPFIRFFSFADLLPKMQAVIGTDPRIDRALPHFQTA